MIQASSPAKAILFGEHAVVYGEPAIALALDLRMRIEVVNSDRFSVDGSGLRYKRHRYVKWAVENLWDGPPFSMRTDSDIPSASGMGSSAALSCSVAGAIRTMKGSFSEESVARDAFEVEYNVQGRASPTDTSCSAHGRAILISPEKGSDLLWTIGKEGRTWNVHDAPLPAMKLVVGYTKTASATHVQVNKVKRYYERSGFAKETIKEIGQLTLEGRDALGKGDLVRVGELMDRNHSLLSILGVNTKELQKLRDAASPFSYGAKLTGAGGGGSMIALTDRPDKVSEAISKRGGVPFIVSPAPVGTTIRVVDAPGAPPMGRSA